MKRAAVAAFALLIGCATPIDEWHGDVTFSEEQRAAIERGNSFLAKRLNVRPYGIVWDAPHVDDSTPCPYATICKRGRIESPPSCAGKDGCGGRGSVQIDPDASPNVDSLAAMAGHEFGHERGLRHHEGPGLMNPTVPLFPMWAEGDDQ